MCRDIGCLGEPLSQGYAMLYGLYNLSMAVETFNKHCFTQRPDQRDQRLKTWMF